MTLGKKGHGNLGQRQLSTAATPQHLQRPTTSPTPTVLVIPFECVQNTEQVNGRGQDNKHVEYLMGAAPDIELSRIEPFRKPRAIYEGAEEDDPALRVVVGQSGLLVELLEREQPRRVDDGGERGEARQDKDGEPEQAILTALVGGMDDDVDRQSPKGPNLSRVFGWSVTTSPRNETERKKEKLWISNRIPLSSTCSARWVHSKTPRRCRTRNRRE